MSTIQIKDGNGDLKELLTITDNEGVQSLVKVDMKFELALQMGRIDGYSKIDKFGIAPQDNTPTDMWEFGGMYNYDTDGTAPIAYISCGDASDVGQTILVTGLDIDGVEVSQEVTTNGQNNVSLSTPLWRVYRAQNISNTGNDLSGIMYIHTDASPTIGVPTSANTRAIINDGNNQTLMALYTIPKGKVGFLYRGELGVELEGNTGALAEYAHIHYESRRLGKIFTTKKVISCIIGGSPTYQDVRSFPDVLPSFTDVKLSAKERTQTMGLFGTFDILLVDEDQFSTEYLQGIGQPNY